MARTKQLGIRISDAAMARLELLANEYHVPRAEVGRALLAESLATPAVVAAARRRLERTL